MLTKFTLPGGPRRMFWFALLACALATARAAEPRKSPLAPLPEKVAEPDANRATPEKIALGKQLFFDLRLSGDNTLSCASCHLPEKALADGRALPLGHGGKSLARNAPSLLNVGFQSTFFWDGRAPSLEEQALAPITSPDEMNQDLAELERELVGISGYAEQFERVFGTRPTRTAIAQALAAFERTLVTGSSPVDRYLAGDKEALSPAARRGLELFVGDAGCAACHHGPLLSDEKFYRLGVSLADEGRAAVTGKADDRAKFRTPSLRNVALTAPYMHNGSLNTLDDVVSFYYRQAPASGPDDLPLDIQPLAGQSFSEIADLVAFLEALTGDVPKIEPPALP